jgi:hypothetical protein
MKAIICGALLALTITTANAADDLDRANYLLPYCKLTATERLANTENAHFNGRREAIVQTVSAVLGMGVCCVGLPTASII